VGRRFPPPLTILSKTYVAIKPQKLWRTLRVRHSF
jgi:hypothetical protein